MSKLIYIVDDEPDILNLISVALEKEFFSIKKNATCKSFI